MTEADPLEEILRRVRVVAVVGCSRHEQKDAHRIPSFLKDMGFDLIPVNPKADFILGEPAYPDLVTAQDQHAEPIELVDVFRPSEDVPPIADQAIEIGAQGLWLQLGIRNEEAARRAREAGLTVVQNRCIYREYTRLFGTQPLEAWRG